MGDLERETKPMENAKASPEKEQVKAPSGEKEPTLGKTYTEEEFGKAQSAWDRQITLAKAEADKAKAEAEQFKAEKESLGVENQGLRSEYDNLAEQQFANDPEARQAFLSRKSIADERRKLAKDTADVERRRYEAEKLAWSVRMAQKAGELIKETGIDAKELEACHTEEEMEVKALRFQMEKPKKEPEPKEEPSQFASTTSTIGGSGKLTVKQVKDMSPEERTARAKEIAELPLGLK